MAEDATGRARAVTRTVLAGVRPGDRILVQYPSEPGWWEVYVLGERDGHYAVMDGREEVSVVTADGIERAMAVGPRGGYNRTVIGSRAQVNRIGTIYDDAAWRGVMAEGREALDRVVAESRGPHRPPGEEPAAEPAAVPTRRLRGKTAPSAFAAAAPDDVVPRAAPPSLAGETPGGVVGGRRLWNRAPAVAVAEDQGTLLGPPLLPMRDDPLADGTATPRGDRLVEADGRIWVAAEETVGTKLGDEVAALDVRAFVMDSGLVAKGEQVIRVERMLPADVPAFVDRRRALFRAWGQVGENATGSAAIVPVKPGGGDLTLAKKDPSDRGDVRTLPVDRDGQGERHKDWRAVTREIYSEVFFDFPIEGPVSVIFLAKHMEKHGRTPRGWADVFVRERGFGSGDRVVHEVRTLVEVLELAGSYDQLNLGCLASMEFVGRRLQAIMDAHSGNAQKPNYDNASLFAGMTRAVDGVSPDLKAFVARKAKDDAEIEKQRQKVRELKAPPTKAPAPTKP